MKYAYLILLTVALFLPACAAYRPLQIQSVAKPTLVVQPTLAEAYYFADRDKDLFFYFHDKTNDPATGQPLEQITMIRMFWQPIGGRTSLNPTSVNATFRYIVVTAGAAGMYEGAGFIRNYDSPGDATVTARILDGDLRLTEATANFNDSLGRARITGRFSAKLDEVKTLDLMQQARRDFFNRSLILATTPELVPLPSATAPATSPAPILEGTGPVK